MKSHDTAHSEVAWAGRSAGQMNEVHCKHALDVVARSTDPCRRTQLDSEFLSVVALDLATTLSSPNTVDTAVRERKHGSRITSDK